MLDFEYTEGEPLDYNSNTLTSNLTATIVFYVYVILGLDFDSFAPKGGTTYIQQAQQIVNMAQSEMSWTGWKAFDSNQNRHAVATALQDNASDAFRESGTRITGKDSMKCSKSGSWTYVRH